MTYLSDLEEGEDVVFQEVCEDCGDPALLFEMLPEPGQDNWMSNQVELPPIYLYETILVHGDIDCDSSHSTHWMAEIGLGLTQALERGRIVGFHVNADDIINMPKAVAQHRLSG